LVGTYPFYFQCIDRYLCIYHKHLPFLSTCVVIMQQFICHELQRKFVVNVMEHHIIWVASGRWQYVVAKVSQMLFFPECIKDEKVMKAFLYKKYKVVRKAPHVRDGRKFNSYFHKSQYCIIDRLIHLVTDITNACSYCIVLLIF